MKMLDFNRYTGQYDIESVIGGFESGALSDGDSVEVEGMIHRIRAMKSFAFFVRNLVQCVYEPKEGQKPV